jgi:hypothetical protein
MARVTEIGAVAERDGGDRKRRGRNLALAAVLLAVVVLFYILTFVRMGTGS